MGNVEWFTGLNLMPTSLPSNPGAVNRALHGVSFATEKDAINHARKLRIAEIDRLQMEVNALDARFDTLEDEEMAADLQQRMRDTDHLDVTFQR